MIRAAALLLTAFPTQAQDFQGFRPGDQVSELARLGEPDFHIPQSDALPVTEAGYPLPFGNYLRVMHSDGRILFLEASADLNPDTPPTTGFQAWATTLGDAVRQAGSEGWFFEGESQIVAGITSISYALSYDLPAHPDYFLTLVFFDAEGQTTRLDDGLFDLPPDIPFLSAQLTHHDLVAQNPAFFGTTRIDRPGVAPFALALSEAFPLTELPQN